MIRNGLKEYWYFIPVGMLVLFYLYQHMKQPKVRTGPVLNIVTGGVDSGILQNVQRTLDIVAKRSQPGTQTSASINPKP